MMKQEFIERLSAGIKEPTETEYKAIETVYTFHPALLGADAKIRIAMLYSTFGMTVIYDMLPRAEKLADLDRQLHEAQAKVSGIEKQICNLSI